MTEIGRGSLGWACPVLFSTVGGIHRDLMASGSVFDRGLRGFVTSRPSQADASIGLSGRAPRCGALTNGASVPPREHRLSTSVLVIGTGGSGLRAAIELAEAGVAVLAVGK